MKLIEKELNFQNKVNDGYSIEIEAEYSKIPEEYATCNEFFRLQHDGSMMNGVEYISNMPLTLHKLKNKVKKLLEDPRFYNNYINCPRASTHVHVNVQEWTKDELLVVLICYYLLEPIVLKFPEKHRVGNLFCLPLWQSNSVIQYFDKIVDGDFEGLARSFEELKYGALNIASIGRLGTIEFRALEGTKDYKTIWIWLDMIQTICMTRKLFKDIDEVWAKYCEDPLQFCLEILGDYILKYDDINRIIDKNHSLVFSMICSPNRIKRKKLNKNKDLKFYTEMELDDGDFYG